MSLETSKMIYQQQKVAAMIAEKMTKSKGLEHTVYKVPTGFQVVAVTKLKSGMPPAKPLPVMQPKPVSMKVPTGEQVVIDRTSGAKARSMWTHGWPTASRCRSARPRFWAGR